MLHIFILYSFHVSQFSDCRFLMLHFLHVVLFPCTISVLHFLMLCYFFHFSCFLRAAHSLFYTFFVLRSFNILLLLSVFMFSSCFTFFTLFRAAFIFLYFCVALISCELSSSCILFTFQFFMLHSFYVVLYSYCARFMLLHSCCTIFMFSFCVALFSCWIFFVLHSSHVELSKVNFFWAISL